MQRSAAEWSGVAVGGADWHAAPSVGGADGSEAREAG